MRTRYKVIIVGSGPAGSATALALAKLDPALARDALILEKTTHPRLKLCGGGVTPLADAQLRALGVWPEVPEFPIWRVDFRIAGGGIRLEQRQTPIFRVVDRRVFDQSLIRHAQRGGATLREGEPVQSVEAHKSGVYVKTPHAEYEADLLVAADGAKSMVRRQLLPRLARSRISRLLEVLTPESNEHSLFRSHTAIFDFDCLAAGVQGYCWDFPSLRDGTPTMNSGIFDSRLDLRSPRADLRQALDRFLQPERSLGDYPLQGHPERWYHPGAIVHLPRVLFVGEAAGIEPFAGEGIAFALAYGRFAASSLHRAFELDDFTLDDYPLRIRRSIGHEMNQRRLTASLAYRFRSPLFWRLVFRLSLPVLPFLFPPGLAVKALR